jgi:hypothetical protein
MDWMPGSGSHSPRTCQGSQAQAGQAQNGTRNRPRSRGECESLETYSVTDANTFNTAR